MCGILISGPAKRFWSFLSWKKVSLHGPVSVREHRWNLIKGVLDHVWVKVKLDVDAGKFVGRFTKWLGSKAALASKPVCVQRKNEKDKKTVGWGSQKDICGERRPWKLEECKMYVCVFVGHGLRSTSFVLGVAKRSDVPIGSARTSLTYPSSFCQAGTRTTAGDLWLCKLQRNKHELPVNTPSPNAHSRLVLQISPLHSERRQYIFLNCSSAILLAIVARLSLSLFFKQKSLQARQFLRAV